jgi:hypothetical protein
MLKLIEIAEKKYGTIYPCSNKETLQECISIEHDNKMYFWFNTPDNSTHVVKEK